MDSRFLPFRLRASLSLLRSRKAAFIPKSILITGASSGLGEALARAYAISGATLHLMGRDEKRLADVVEFCRTQGAQVFSHICDVRDEAEMRAWILSQDAIAPIDCVIANAGISAGTGNASEEELQARMIWDVNVGGVLNAVWPVLPAMQRRKRGSVVLISSLAGLYPLPNAPAYSASKAALRYYADALRASVVSDNVNVLVAYPGFIDTPMTRINPFPMPLLMRAEKAALHIIHAVSCGKPRVSFPFSLLLAVRGLHFLPQKLVHSVLMRVPSKPQIS